MVRGRRAACCGRECANRTHAAPASQAPPRRPPHMLRLLTWLVNRHANLSRGGRRAGAEGQGSVELFADSPPTLRPTAAATHTHTHTCMHTAYPSAPLQLVRVARVLVPRLHQRTPHGVESLVVLAQQLAVSCAQRLALRGVRGRAGAGRGGAGSCVCAAGGGSAAQAAGPHRTPAHAPSRSYTAHLILEVGQHVGICVRLLLACRAAPHAVHAAVGVEVCPAPGRRVGGWAGGSAVSAATPQNRNTPGAAWHPAAFPVPPHAPPTPLQYARTYRQELELPLEALDLVVQRVALRAQLTQLTHVPLRGRVYVGG